MDIIYGLGGVLLGAAFAYFTTGESGLAWGIVGVFVVLAFVVSAHLTGIRKGEKRAATDL